MAAILKTAPALPTTIIDLGGPAAEFASRVALVTASGRTVALVATGEVTDKMEAELWRLGDAYGLTGHWERPTMNDPPVFVQHYQSWDGLLGAYGEGIDPLKG
jgi:hypothetical protein